MDKYITAPIFFKLCDDQRNKHKELKTCGHIIAFDCGKRAGAKAFFGVADLKELSKLISDMPKDMRVLYEYRETPRGKIFFDIDWTMPTDGEPKGFLDDVCSVIINCLNTAWDYNPIFKKEDLYIYTSTRPDKISYHIIVRKYYLDDIIIIKNIVGEMNKDINHIYPKCGNIIDPAIYNKAGCFRLLHNRKKGVKNSKKAFSEQPDVNTFKASMVTVLKGCTNVGPPTNLFWNTTEDDEEIDDLDLVEGDELLVEDEAKAEVYINNMADHRADNYGDWFTVCVALKRVGNTERMRELFHAFSQRSSKYDEGECERMWKSIDRRKKGYRLKSLYCMARTDNPKERMPNPSRGGVDAKKRLIEHYCGAYINPLVDLGVYRSLKSVIVVRKNQEHLWKLPNGNVLVRSALGTGKTYQIEQLREIQNRKYSVLFMSNRRKFAREIEERFKTYGIECYLDYKGSCINSEKSRRMICQPESLYKIDPPRSGYDIIIIDEVESVLSQFSSTTFSPKDDEDTRYHDCSSMFYKVLKDGGRIIAMDGFLNNRSVNSLTMFKDKKWKLLINDWKPEQRKAYEIPLTAVRESETKTTFKPIALLEKGMELLRAGKKICLVFSAREWMNKFVKMAKKEKFKGKWYSSENSAENLRFNAKNEWLDCQYVCYTTSITTGVNFDTRGIFDNLLVYFSNTPLVRDIFQAMHRIRHFNSKDIFYSVQSFSIPQNGKVTIEGVSDELERTKKVLADNEFIKIGSNPFLKDIHMWNTIEKRLQSHMVGYLWLINKYFELFNIKLDDSIEQEECDCFEEDVAPDDYDEIINNIESYNQTDLLEKIGNGVATPLEKRIFKMMVFITQFKVNIEHPEWKTMLKEPWLELAKKKPFRAQLQHVLETIYDYDDIGFDIDVTDPKAKKLAKKSVRRDLITSLEMKDYSPVQTKEISRSVVDALPPNVLKAWAVETFKMRDITTIEGKKVAVTVPTQKDNIRYVKHIFQTYLGCKVTMTRNSKKKDIQEKVSIVPNQLICQLFELISYDKIRSP